MKITIKKFTVWVSLDLQTSRLSLESFYGCLRTPKCNLSSPKKTTIVILVIVIYFTII